MFANHIFAKGPELPPMESYLYEYVIGSNGVFVRAQRPGLEALIWVAALPAPIRGLSEVSPYVCMFNRIPADLVNRMIAKAYRAEGKEILFYLTPDPWRLTVPDQVQSGASVHPVDPYAGGTQTLVEVHSHHFMKAFFSNTDNREEQTGFRVYAVLGDLGRRPSIKVRVGIYGHFWEIPASWVFELPSGVHDALWTAARYSVKEEIWYDYTV